MEPVKQETEKKVVTLPAYYKEVPAGQVDEYEKKYGSFAIKYVAGKFYFLDETDPVYLDKQKQKEVNKQKKKDNLRRIRESEVERAEIRAHNNLRAQMVANVAAKKEALKQEMERVREMQDAIPAKKKSAKSKKGSAAPAPASVASPTATPAVSTK